MKSSVRRLLLFLITVGTGSLIIVFDAPAEVIVAGTVLAGFCALLVTGALKIADLKPSRLRAALREQRQKKNEEADTAAEPESGGMFGTLAASVRGAITHARATEGEKKRSIEEIDTLLDQAVEGSAPQKPAGIGVDPLAALADLDLAALEDLDPDEAAAPKRGFESDRISLLSGGEADAVSEILRAHQSELDPPGSSDITADLSELPAMSTLSVDLSALDDLELDEIEIEGEEIADEAADEKEPAPEEVVPEEPVEKPKEDFDMITFASGGVADDDLITSLKSDVKKKKFVEDVSLVRELRGEKYDARELAAELEEVLAMLKPR